jgi:hypothetical protein
MTVQQLQALEKGTVLWDKDWGLVEFIRVVPHHVLYAAAEVLTSRGSIATICITDLSLPTSLMKELG